MGWFHSCKWEMGWKCSWRSIWRSIWITSSSSFCFWFISNLMETTIGNILASLIPWIIRLASHTICSKRTNLSSWWKLDWLVPSQKKISIWEFLHSYQYSSIHNICYFCNWSSTTKWCAWTLAKHHFTFHVNRTSLWEDAIQFWGCNEERITRCWTIISWWIWCSCW